MKSELSQELEARFHYYKELWNTGARYRAVMRLAEIYHCIPSLTESEQSSWMARISSQPLSENVLLGIESGIKADVERVRKVLSFGTRWTAEELVLIVQTRIEIELLAKFLTELTSAKPTESINDIDEKIIALARSRDHRNDFKWVIRTMKKNWGLPIDSKWLREKYEDADP